MTTFCSNNPDWNNISSIQFDDNVMSIKQENEEILLSVAVKVLNESSSYGDYFYSDRSRTIANIIH